MRVRELETKVRSRTLPLSCIGILILEVSSSPSLSSYSVNNSVKVVGAC